MTRASARKHPARASNGQQNRVIHALARPQAGDTIPYIRQAPRSHTLRPDAGLGQFNDS
jgi:hypothetical protein